MPELLILVTGSSQGIGLETARALAAMGHRVVVHARNEERAAALRRTLPAASGVVVGDLDRLAETRDLAERVNALGRFDVVIHNAGLGGGVERREETADGIERLFQVNVLAPYVLTALMPRPHRLVYLTSGLESQGRIVIDDLQRQRRPWNGMAQYSDTKLGDVLLAFAVARIWPDIISNAVDPGWIQTRMGGPGATDPLPLGAETQVWLATSDEPAATATGRYLKRRQELEANPQAHDVALQDALLAECARLTGVTLPAAG